jgi:hypothetical protein
MSDDLLLRPGVAVETALTNLKELVTGATNTRSAAGNNLMFQDRYLAWVSGAAFQLRGLFASPEVWQGLHTDRYWQVADLNTRTPRPSELMHDEATWQATRIQTIVAVLERDQEALGLLLSGACPPRWA